MDNTNPTACFTYGSLMSDDIMSAVSGVRAAHCSATLDGYCRHPVIGAAYPGMVASAGHQVRGSRLDKGDWDFERFLREGKARFVAEYVGFDTLQAGHKTERP